MASPETHYPDRQVPPGYVPPRTKSNATWYIVLGAAVLLVLAYFMTAGMVGQVEPVVTEPQNRVETPIDPIPAVPQEGATGAPVTPAPEAVPTIPPPAN